MNLNLKPKMRHQRPFHVTAQLVCSAIRFSLISSIFCRLHQPLAQYPHTNLCMAFSKLFCKNNDNQFQLLYNSIVRQFLFARNHTENNQINRNTYKKVTFFQRHEASLLMMHSMSNSTSKGIRWIRKKKKRNTTFVHFRFDWLFSFILRQEMIKYFPNFV